LGQQWDAQVPHPGAVNIARTRLYLEFMGASRRRSGPRSGLYSEQRFTNWTPHDPYWLETEALPKRMRPKATVPRPSGDPLKILERRLAPGFVRPFTAPDVAAVLSCIPADFLNELAGVYLMAGTAKQGRARVPTYGMYWENQVFLFPVPAQRLAEGWFCSTNRAELQRYLACGAGLRSGRRGMIVQFDDESLRRFYLCEVLLHEVGHHVDRNRRSAKAGERYADWFAEFQRVNLPPLMRKHA